MQLDTAMSQMRAARPGVEQKYWEEYFTAARRLGHSWKDEAKTLAPLIFRLRSHGVSRVLDLGCGAGDLSHLLGRARFEVTGLDLAGSALRFARERHPGLKVVQADVTRSLPIRSKAFDAVVACLALHYFPWGATVAISEEVHRLIREGGLFFFRVNSTADQAHGAGRGQKVGPHLYECGGRLKRFFDEADCRSLVRCFGLHYLEHRLIPHLDCVDGRWAVRQKAVWDGLAQKGGAIPPERCHATGTA
ncbi:MAG: class I SAM-dependent methyltransferase [bacterium]|nr:class I SAM-dependent methyltransferase [bacterium]